MIDKIDNYDNSRSDCATLTLVPSLAT